ncbi:exosome component 10-like [Protobothrops mucrosquamatus]|uniref:exosome component 10-like n=1 Tax=Protobothrops mucrosquamatus TaxID=103944 RepID=UPI00077576B7|nr:exosome component 10-like [Protobothrops mucrosquamatus]
MFTKTYEGPGLPLEHAKLFSEAEQTGLVSPLCLQFRASISVFNEPEEDQKGENLTVAQLKAQHIMESFENPFRMYLPAELNPVHISQAAKADPSSKIYEISNRWKLLSQAQLQAGAKKGSAKQKPQAASVPQAAPKEAEKEPRIKDTENVSVRQLAAQEQAAPKREAAEENPATETLQRKKAKPDSPQPEADAAASRFTPFDYSKSDFRVFAGSSKSKPSRQFNPALQALGSKKFSGAGKSQQPAGTKSMSFTGGKSNRGFRHNWPKR